METTALALHSGGGLANLSQPDFEARLNLLKVSRERVKMLHKELMVQGEDYGVIPGTNKPALLKPGAEILCKAYDVVPCFEEELIHGDGVVLPHLRIITHCYLHAGSKDGPIVGEGVGASNSWERKHRYRGAGRACPDCKAVGTIKRSKFERGGDKGYYCHEKAGGCGAEFHSEDPKIADQQVGMIENRDPYDNENTLHKMAAKRAQVDAVLRFTASSGLFAQDTEDLDDAGDGKDVKPATSDVIDAETVPGSEGTAAPQAGEPQQQPQTSAPAGERQTNGIERIAPGGCKILKDNPKLYKVTTNAREYTFFADDRKDPDFDGVRLYSQCQSAERDKLDIRTTFTQSGKYFNLHAIKRATA